MRDYGFDFDSLPYLSKCAACPFRGYCDELSDDDPTPCQEQEEYNRARAMRLSSEF